MKRNFDVLADKKRLSQKKTTKKQKTRNAILSTLN